REVRRRAAKHAGSGGGPRDRRERQAGVAKAGALHPSYGLGTPTGLLLLIGTGPRVYRAAPARARPGGKARGVMAKRAKTPLIVRLQGGRLVTWPCWCRAGLLGAAHSTVALRPGKALLRQENGCPSSCRARHDDGHPLLRVVD